MAGEKGRVLVVDDDSLVRNSLAALLEEEFAVECAPDASVADALLNAHPFEVVLADFEMPGRNGVDFLRDVRTRFPGMMGVLITGHADHPSVLAANRSAEVSRVIEKPYDPERMLRWVDNVVKLARLQRSMGSVKARLP
ncbi:MAG: response regulator [Archangium sp.]